MEGLSGPWFVEGCNECKESFGKHYSKVVEELFQDF